MRLHLQNISRIKFQATLLLLFFASFSFAQNAPPNYSVSIHCSSGSSGQTDFNLSVVYSASHFSGINQYVSQEILTVYEYDEESDAISTVDLNVPMYAVEYLDNGNLIRAVGAVSHLMFDPVKLSYNGARSANIYNGLQLPGSNTIALNDGTVHIELPINFYNVITEVTPFFTSNPYDQFTGFLLTGLYSGYGGNTRFHRGSPGLLQGPYYYHNTPIVANDYFPIGMLSLNNYGGAGYNALASPADRTYVIGTYVKFGTTSYHAFSYHESIWEVTGAACGLDVLASDTSLLLSAGQIQLTSSMLDAGSDTSCGLLNAYVNPSSLNCSNVGFNAVQLIMEDLSGNIDSASAIVEILDNSLSASIVAQPTSTVYTGGNPNKIYIGYGPQSVNLMSNAVGGANMTYSWSGGNLSCTNCPNPEFTPSTEGLYTLTVVVTDPSACFNAVDSIQIEVEDITADKKGKKVYLCHVDDKKPTKTKTKKVKLNKVSDHIGAHSLDYLGKCEGSSNKMSVPSVKDDKELVEMVNSAKLGSNQPIIIYPNPSNNEFIVNLQVTHKSAGLVRIIDLSGKVLISQNLKLNSGLNQVTIGAELPQGLYILDFISEGKREVRKIQKL